MLPLFLAGSFCITFLVAFVLNRLALSPWRRTVGQHWTERARVLYPARFSARLNNWLIPFILVFISIFWAPEVNVFLVGFSGFLGTALAGFFLQREIFPSLQFGLWLRTIMAIFFIIFLWFFVLVIPVFEMPENFGPATWVIAAGVFTLLLGFPFGLSILLMRWFRIVLPATETLKSLVAEVSERMQVPVRATWILPTYICNALAFPHTRQMIFTDKLLSTLSDEETKAVCAHELGHLSESRAVLFVRGSILFAFFPLIFIRPFTALDNNNAHAMWILLGTCLFSILVIFSIKSLGRRMEKRADKMAVENQSDAVVYARTLERIYEVSQMPAVMPRRSAKVHPDLYDRMTVAGVTPNFPRPLPPKKQCWTSYLMFVCLVLVPFVYAFWKAVQMTLNGNNSYSP